jgi:RNA polymerase sigma factor (sigma-70 family)
MVVIVTLTEAEQNRLIQANMGIVAPIAAEYRGRKGIPFEDLEAQGMVGLVEAARNYDPTAGTKFSSWATHRIRGSIANFVDRWQVFVPLDEFSDIDEEKIHEWQIWGDFPSEGWNMLPATPEQIVEAYQTVAGKSAALSAAFLSLTKRERRMVSARFLQEPPVMLEQIARDHKVSYLRAVKIVYESVKKLRDIVSKIEQGGRGKKNTNSRFKLAPGPHSEQAATAGPLG